MDEERISNWRWGLYFTCLGSGIIVPVVGQYVEKTGNWIVPFTILYCTWVFMFTLFVMTFFERTPQFIIRCLYYLICFIPVLAFFGSLSNLTLHFWLPASSSVGIFLGVALRDCCILVAEQRPRVRRTLLRILRENEPPLPQYHRRASAPANVISTGAQGPISDSSSTSASAATPTSDTDDHIDRQRPVSGAGSNPTDNPSAIS